VAFYYSFIRIPLLVAWQSWRPLKPIETFEPEVLEFRVWPGDIDFNLHLNNARHLSVMDYGRVHLLARGGVIREIMKRRWEPVVGEVWITYRRSLPLWAKYRLATRMVGWDNRWFYMEQTFTGDQGLVASGWVKAALRDKKGAVNPQLVMDAVRPGVASPPLPEAIETLNELTRVKLRNAR
jgi:acyl-CoA thioesterase FadM